MKTIEIKCATCKKGYIIKKSTLTIWDKTEGYKCEECFKNTQKYYDNHENF